MDTEPASEDADKPASHKRKWTSSPTSNAGSESEKSVTIQVDPIPQWMSYDDLEVLKKKQRLEPPESAPQATAGDTYGPVWISRLPPELLQHIFSFVDPISLGRLISVNRMFNCLLDPTKLLPQASTQPSCVPLKVQDEIWTNSRRDFLTGSPRPMSNMTELEMWKLLRGRRCQFCGKEPNNRKSSLTNSPWNSGPGPEGIRTIWPFRVHTCGKCLEARSIKETEVLFSSASALVPGLPFAFFTPSFHYVKSVTLKNLQPPPRLQLTKYYFRSQIEVVDKQSAKVRALGTSAAEEWYKGLHVQGETCMEEAARFESRESPNLGHVQSNISPVSMFTPTPLTSQAVLMPPTASKLSFNNLQSPVGTHLSQGFTRKDPTYASSFLPGVLPPMPLQQIGLAPGQQKPLDISFGPSHQLQGTPPGISQVPLQHKPRPRAERNAAEVTRKKAERRAEIERRCEQLEPPLKASTLPYMEAFNAAIQIPMDLNDSAWEVLKSRLLIQRAEAEVKEEKYLASIRASQMEEDERRKYEERQKLVQENATRTWNEIVQKPTREKIRQIADEYIAGEWFGGQNISIQNHRQFAARILCHIRQRYQELLAEEDTTLASQGMPIPYDSSINNSRRLKLEDMKWIFEQAVRPHTDAFGWELFLCSACDNNHKPFSLEAVIQHYAAKHTSALSYGNAVVYWKADWPAEPPFHPSPETITIQDGAHRNTDVPRLHNRPPASWMSTATRQPASSRKTSADRLVAPSPSAMDTGSQLGSEALGKQIDTRTTPSSMSWTDGFGMRGTGRPLEGAPENEYDPHKPLATTMTRYGSARFDSHQPPIPSVSRFRSVQHNGNPSPARDDPMDQSPRETIYPAHSALVRGATDNSPIRQEGRMEYEVNRSKYYDFPVGETLRRQTEPDRQRFLEDHPIARHGAGRIHEIERPATDSEYGPNAAENFLNNFESILDAGFEGESSNKVMNPRVASLVVANDRIQGSGSLRESPRYNLHRPVLDETRSESRNNPSVEYAQTQPTVIDMHQDIHMQDLIPLRTQDIQDIPPSQDTINSRYYDTATENIRNERDLGRVNARKVTHEHYRRLSPESEYPYKQHSPSGFYQQRVERRPVRYVEVLPSGERRYIEELPYVESTYREVEYVRVPPRNYPVQERYYAGQREIDDYPVRHRYETRNSEDPVYLQDEQYYRNTTRQTRRYENEQFDRQ